MCLASDAAIRQLVCSLTEAFTTAQDLSCREVCLREEPSRCAPADRPPLFFAVAFKSRFAGPQKAQTDAGRKKQACEDSSAANLAASAATNAGLLDVQHGRTHQPDEQQGQQTLESTGIPVSSHEGSSIPRQPDQVIPLTSDSSTGEKGRCGRQEEQEVLHIGQTGSVSTNISRKIAIAAAADSFATACKGAEIRAQVNLKQPSIVICLEVLLVGSVTIAAASIVDSKACILKPKLTLKPLQM